MSNNNSFIGTGKNPEGPDLPLGLGMNLAQAPKAHKAYSNLSNDRKQALINYLQSESSGDGAKARMEQAVESLNRGDIGFF